MIATHRVAPGAQADVTTAAGLCTRVKPQIRKTRAQRERERGSRKKKGRQIDRGFRTWKMETRARRRHHRRPPVVFSTPARGTITDFIAGKHRGQSVVSVGSPATSSLPLAPWSRQRSIAFAASSVGANQTSQRQPWRRADGTPLPPKQDILLRMFPSRYPQVVQYFAQTACSHPCSPQDRLYRTS